MGVLTPRYASTTSPSLARDKVTCCQAADCNNVQPGRWISSITQSDCLHIMPSSEMLSTNIREDLSDRCTLEHTHVLGESAPVSPLPPRHTQDKGSRPWFPLPIPLPLHSLLWRHNIELLLRVARGFALIIQPLCGVRLFNDIYGPGFIYREESVGFWESVLYFTGILNAESVRQLHWNINCWTEKQFFAWKKTYVANCSAIAVTVSLDVCPALNVCC